MKICCSKLLFPALLIFALSFRVLAAETQTPSLVLACKVQNIIAMPVDDSDKKTGIIDDESQHYCRYKGLSLANCKYESEIIFEFFGNREKGYIYREGSYGRSLERYSETGTLLVFKGYNKLGTATKDPRTESHHYVFNRRSGRIIGFELYRSPDSRTIERTSLGQCRVERPKRLF